MPHVPAAGKSNGFDFDIPMVVLWRGQFRKRRSAGLGPGGRVRQNTDERLVHLPFLAHPTGQCHQIPGSHRDFADRFHTHPAGVILKHQQRPLGAVVGD